MLRGVNKRIIEVNETGSDYFEKALFFVKGNADFNEATLEREAQSIMLSYFEPQTKPAGQKGYLRYTEERKQKRLKGLFLTAGILLFAVITAAVLYMVL